MKTEWDSYLDRQLTNPTVRQAYEEETKFSPPGCSAPSSACRPPISIVNFVAVMTAAKD